MSGRALITVLASIFTVALLFSGTGQGAEITVDDSGGADYDTIGEALDNASPGDIISVYVGTYTERLWINTSVTINADGDATIDSEKTGTVVTIYADDVTLIGFSIANATGSPDKKGLDGILVDGATGTFIEDCSLQRNENGIASDGCTDLRIKDVDCEKVKRAIYLRDVDMPRIEGIRVADANSVGVHLYRCTNGFLGPSAMRSSIIGNALYGVQVQDSFNLTLNFTGSDFSTGGLQVRDSIGIDAVVSLNDPGGDGVYIEETSDIALSGNIWFEYTGVNIWSNCTDVDIRDLDLICTGEQTTSRGILARMMVDHVTVSDVMVENAQNSLRLEEDATIVASDVTFFAGSNYDVDAYVRSSGLVLQNPTFANGSAGSFDLFDGAYVSLVYGITAKVIDSDKDPVTGADVRIRSDEGDHYRSAYWSGSDPKTDTSGLSGEALVPYALITEAGTTYNASHLDVHTPAWDGTMELDSSTRSVVVIVTNDPPEIDGYVSNSAGQRHAGIPIYFVAEYIDNEGVMASLAQVRIDNVTYGLTYQSGQPTTGALYGYQTYLAQGKYWIYFRFNDSVVSSSTDGFLLTVANAPPALDLPLPDLYYYNDEDFLPNWSFKVRYTDADGDPARAVHLLFEGENITMFEHDANDTTITDGKDFNATVFDLDDDTYTYGFAAHDGTHWIVTGPFSLTVEMDRPVLAGLSVSPATGNASTEFEFRVTYSHMANVHPGNDPVNGVPDLVIGNLEYPMVPVDPDEDNVVFGKEFYLRRSGIPHGNYSFHAQASDRFFTRASVTKYVLVNNSVPTMTFEQDPIEGASGQFYTMKITYTDLDGDLPTTLSVRIDTITLYTRDSGVKRITVDDVDDNSTFNGKVYWINDTFYHGLHDYIMKTNDGRGEVTVYGEFPVDQRPRVNARREGAPIPIEGEDQRFVCNYSDADNNGPAYVNIIFSKFGTPNGTLEFGPFAMKPTQPKDTKYDDGKEFSYTEDFLEEEGAYGPGDYQYRIETSDGYLKRTLVEDTMLFFVRPKDKPPVLTDPLVSPLKGGPDTIITFSVVYSDPDGDAPNSVSVHLHAGPSRTVYPLEKAVGEGNDFIAGVRYELAQSLTWADEYAVSFRAVSGGASDEVDYMGGVIVIEGGETRSADDGPTGQNYMFLIVLAAVLPIVIAVALGLVLRRRRKKPAEEAVVEKEKTGDEEIEWGFEEEGEGEEYDEEDIDWE
ncbi:MAG: right-handed parallel beta-helix repeat-containing protein [Thermoplasmata archaeon]|nr:right-handed parallel beta-helix repeat-containing protein [Thermoplasmata archaeon]